MQINSILGHLERVWVVFVKECLLPYMVISDEQTSDEASIL